MNPITPVTNTNSIRCADFVRVTSRNRFSAPFAIGQDYTILSHGTTDFMAIGAANNNVGTAFTATGAGSGNGVATQVAVYRFSTAPNAMTISAVDSNAFLGLGSLVSVGSVTRDIKSTANETQFTLVGIDPTMLGVVLGADIKGSLIEAWHGFFNTDGTLITSGGTGGLYKFFTGYVNSFAINEQWMEEISQMIGTIAITASSVQIILKNRIAGRYTNDANWKFFNPTDTSMERVAPISSLTWAFGKTQ
ncbi:hypothetical protein UFOVP83_12 [uncultured Caudovirales phage]|uniref:Uncharacterized protein n=1 Tax=uncultured Caudovirales phage TaxID=2100421 RepID=A0A6J5TBD9_9CAUD|nr:hypothetical protein UFOVP83_12 [uncultured Caudovirales phage]